MERTAVTRSIELRTSAQDAWSSLADAEGLSAWLGDHVELEALHGGAIVAGTAGRVVDAGTTRRMVVTEVDEGRSIGFAWWSEADPSLVTTVSVEVTPGADDEQCTVTVTEQVAGGALAGCAHASVADLVDIEHRWDARLDALVGSSSSRFAPALV